ncbi:type II secretion system F family protein [Marinicellulosiphila megalodicopiae]|uniref:type II secretion system F family protein n=1 Tax=Marinicellulosiphila megalodicopiae TaxID=2724896 RepID=UPI003BAF8E6D
MSEYKYKSMDEYGKSFEGRMHANNVFELEALINNQDQDLINYKVVKQRAFRLGARKLNRKDIINMVVQLEQLTKSGVPLLDGLSDLRDSADEGYYRDLLSSLVESIQGGKTFSEALKDFENDFDQVFISLIEIGEESGELDKILKDMGASLRWIDELISATVKLLTYPAIVGLVVLAVTGFLMVYLVPQILPFILEMGGEVPFHTKALIIVSGVFINYWWAIFIMPFIIFYTLKTMGKRSKKVKYRLDYLKLKAPIFGNILLKIKLARLANYMSLLYASGINVLRALQICENLMDNAVLEEALREVGKKIRDGKGISDSFKQTQIFPPLVIRMVKVGESTGNLDESLLNISYFYNREVQGAIDKIEPAISPILSVVMGTLLGWIMMSVLGPVWDAIGNIG